jgi:hypothetical protein
MKPRPLFLAATGPAATARAATGLTATGLAATGLAATALLIAGTAFAQTPDIYGTPPVQSPSSPGAAPGPAPGAAPAPIPGPPPGPPPAPMPGAPPPAYPQMAPYPQMPYRQMPMPAPTVVEEAPAPPRRPRVDTWQALVGVRAALIRSPGFDPFSNQDGLAQVDLSFSRVLLRQDRLALAAGLGFDYGASSTYARGAPSHLGLTRGSLVIEGRYTFHPHVYGFLRAAPGVLNLSASVDDSSTPPQPNTSPTPLTADFTVPCLDGSLGLAVGLAPPSSRVGAWILAQGGYGWAASHDLLLAPQLGSADQRKIAAIDLGSLSPSGPFMAFSFALSF